LQATTSTLAGGGLALPVDEGPGYSQPRLGTGERMPEEQSFPPQEQSQQPGRETEMRPQPEHDPKTRGAGRLAGKVALITGGDSGIGRAVAQAFAREGADVAISYLEEHEDAEETKRLVEDEGQRALTIAGDVGDENHCEELVRRTVADLGRLDVLVNNAAEQHPQESIAGHLA
jgi:hypothetical protein